VLQHLFPKLQGADESDLCILGMWGWKRGMEKMWGSSNTDHHRRRRGSLMLILPGIAYLSVNKIYILNTEGRVLMPSIKNSGRDISACHRASQITIQMTPISAAPAVKSRWAGIKFQFCYF